jgi:hypothetical protein
VLQLRRTGLPSGSEHPFRKLDDLNKLKKAGASVIGRALLLNEHRRVHLGVGYSDSSLGPVCEKTLPTGAGLAKQSFQLAERLWWSPMS